MYYNNELYIVLMIDMIRNKSQRVSNFFFQYEIRLYTVVSQGQIHKLQKEKMYYVGGRYGLFWSRSQVQHWQYSRQVACCTHYLLLKSKVFYKLNESEIEICRNQISNSYSSGPNSIGNTINAVVFSSNGPLHSIFQKMDSCQKFRLEGCGFTWKNKQKAEYSYSWLEIVENIEYS